MIQDHAIMPYFLIGRELNCEPEPKKTSAKIYQFLLGSGRQNFINIQS